MKKLLFILSLVLLSSAAYCAPRSLEQMKAAAAGALGGKGGAATRGASASLNVLKQGMQYTVLGYSTGGFAVIANDDRFDAVLGYSDGNFTSGNIPPAMLWWMEAVDESLRQKLEAGDTQARATDPVSGGYPARVESLVTARWGQNTPYNDQCPTYTYGGRIQRYVTGCVATAMAQIMYYHKYPERGAGRKIYDFTSQEDGQIHSFDIRFSRVTYDWENMIDDYSSGYNALQAEAVSTLMLHCGVSVNMSYNRTGSGAFSSDAANALEEYFLYSTKMYTRDIFTEDEWMDIIYKEISASRPMLYGGSSPTQGGHAFVLDGYDENGLVHINWGWEGDQDGFFEIGALNGFTIQQDMILMHDGDAPEIPYSSQLGIAESIQWSDGVTRRGQFSITTSGNMITYTVNNLLNGDAETFSGRIMLMAEPVDGGNAAILHSMTTMLQPNGGYPTLTQNGISTDRLSDGTYRLFLASQGDNETTWQVVRSNERVVNSYIITVSGGVLTIGEGDAGWTTDIDAVAVTGDGTVRVYTVDGVLVYTAPASEYRLEDVPATGLLIVKNGANTVKVVK